MSTYDIHYGPGDLIPNVVYNKTEAKLTAEDKETLKGTIHTYDSMVPRQLCRACGWTNYHECCSSYLPRLRVFHTRGTRGLWQMGNDWALWDRTEEDRGNDYMTHQFLQKQDTKSIPLIKKMVEFKDENGGFNFVVMSRVKGVRLDAAWKNLDRAAKNGYVQQMVAFLRELRQFTAESPQRVDGSPLWDCIIGNCESRKHCKSIGKTKEEWFNNLDEELREGVSRRLHSKDKAAIERKLQKLKRKFPDGAPYVLTHGDLNMSNIIVDDGKIQAIIDWEYAGYYPWWVETFRAFGSNNIPSTEEFFPAVWKELNLSLDDLYEHIEAVKSVFRLCHITHTEEDIVWRRPPFCKCQPYGGFVRKNVIDSESRHCIDYEAHNGAAPYRKIPSTSDDESE